MDLSVLREELERAFDLDELRELAQTALALRPGQVDGPTKTAYAAALVEHCGRIDAVEALCDAVASRRGSWPEEFAATFQRAEQEPETAQVGERIDGYVIEKVLGAGQRGCVYLARHEDRGVRLKLLRREATDVNRRVARAFAALRLASALNHAGLPQNVVAGSFGGDRIGTAQDEADGRTLDAWQRDRGPIRFRHAWPILRGILDPLAALHENHLVHGDLRASNVLVLDASPDREGTEEIGGVTLLDIGAHFLSTGEGCASPEQFEGHLATSQTDIYAFGLLLYQLLAGRPVFEANSRVEALVAHLEHVPDPLSFVAPRGWITDELDEFVLSLLDKDPKQRPTDARAVREHLETLVQLSAGRESRMPDGEFDARLHALLSDPTDVVAAGVLESSTLQGENPGRIADGFCMAADLLGDDVASRAATARLLSRAAALYERSAGRLDDAESLYTRLLRMDPDDGPARAALERVHRHLGHFDQLVELLLAEIERATTSSERARALARLGSVLLTDLDDRDQALVAYARALCEQPAETRFAQEVERVAGADQNAWNDVLTTCAEAANGELTTDQRTRLLSWMGTWYARRMARPDLALQCYRAMHQADPAGDVALREMANLYRSAQQWPELSEVLQQRADVAMSPAAARDLRIEAAEIRMHRLDDPVEAVRIYEHVLADDPTHRAASEGLLEIYSRDQDWHDVVRVLTNRADALSGEDRWELLCRAADVSRTELTDDAGATRRYEKVLEECPNHLDALRGIERLYEASEKTLELVGVLERQLGSAVTPHQRARLWNRIAKLYADEFYDHGKAAEALENALSVDPTAEPALESLAEHYRALSKWDDLARTYERWSEVASNPTTRADKLHQLAMLCEGELSAPERAAAVYERILEIDPKHTAALDALAQLRAEAGAWDEAVERYRNALEADPKDAAAARGLREAYLAQGKPERVVTLLETAIGDADTEPERAALCAELARVLLDEIGDRGAAQGAAEQALKHDPGHVRAHVVRADALYEKGQVEEAAAHYAEAAGEDVDLPREEQVRVLGRYVDALARSGSAKNALEPVERLLKLAPDDPDALRVSSMLAFDHGTPADAYQRVTHLLLERSEDLTPAQIASALYRKGESARRLGHLGDAEVALEDAVVQGADVDHEVQALALDALVRLHEDRGDWSGMRYALERSVDLAPKAERAERLIVLGDAAVRMKEAHEAGEHYLAALGERPDDRRAQLKLLQLYSDERDWDRLFEVLMRAAESAEEDTTRARYLKTAARVLDEELDEPRRAVELLDRAASLDPSLEDAVQSAVELYRKLDNMPGALSLLSTQIERAAQRQDRERALTLSYELADMHLEMLDVDEAVAVYEAALRLDPGNAKCRELLTELYTSDPGRYLSRAVEAHQSALLHDPLRPEHYESLRQVYESAGEADAQFCVARALCLLNRATPSVEAFYRKHQPRHPAVTAISLTEQDWAERVMHPNAEPLVTEIFGLLQPAVVKTRTKPLSDLIGDGKVLDPEAHDDNLVKMIESAAKVLGVHLPKLVERPDLHGALNLLRSHPPALGLGRHATGSLPARPAAFAAAAHLCFFRPGLYLRFLVATPAALKAWLLASIKLVAPRLPVAPELEGLVQDAQEVLEEHLTGAARDRLAAPVAKLFDRDALIDLDRWVAAVDLTADRVGLLMCDDLEAAVDLIKSSTDKATSVAVTERIKEILRYSVSASYIDVRARLAIGIDAT